MKMKNKKAADLIRAKLEIHRKVFGHDPVEPMKTAYEKAIKALETMPEEDEDDSDQGTDA